MFVCVFHLDWNASQPASISVFHSLFEHVCVSVCMLQLLLYELQIIKRTMPKPMYKWNGIWNTWWCQKSSQTTSSHISCIKSWILFFVSFHFISFIFAFEHLSRSLNSVCIHTLHNASKPMSLLLVVCSHESYAHSFLFLPHYFPSFFSLWVLNKSILYGSRNVFKELTHRTHKHFGSHTDSIEIIARRIFWYVCHICYSHFIVLSTKIHNIYFLFVLFFPTSAVHHPLLIRFPQVIPF